MISTSSLSPSVANESLIVRGAVWVSLVASYMEVGRLSEVAGVSSAAMVKFTVKMSNRTCSTD